MTNVPKDRKISEFVQGVSFQTTDLFNIVRAGTNLQLPASALAPFLGVTGALVPVGTAGTPVLEQPGGSVNNIRTLENGNGFLAAISPTNGITLTWNTVVDSTGVAIIVDKNVPAPVHRSVVGGSGIVVGASGNTIVISATAIGGSNTVIINQESDFPTPVAGVITLADNTNYVIAAAVSTSNRFVVGTNNNLTASNVFSPTLTYTGTGTMFTGIDKTFSINDLSLSCPLAQAFDFKSTVGPGNTVNMDTVVVLASIKWGTFDNLIALVINNSATGTTDDGLTISGTNWLVFSLTRLALLSSSATFIGVDFGTSVHSTLEMDNMVFRAPAGGIGIKGAAASANLSVGNLGTVSKGEFSGGLTPLNTLSSTDVRWDFQQNTGIADTISDALLGFNGNAAETVISVINTPVIVNATWVLEDASKFTIIAGGRATYVAERPAHLPIDIAIGILSASGGSINVSVYLALNGTIISNTGRTISVSSSAGQTLSIPWQLTLSENDFLEVFVENNSGTTNLVVENAILRVN